jgi:hypothetical protein
MRAIHQSFLIAVATLGAAFAHAQGLCDLLPATAVKSALGLSGNLTAKPNTRGGNGCDYKLDGAIPTTVIADPSDASGMVGTIFDQRLKQPGFGAQLVPGLGDAAFYVVEPDQNLLTDQTQSYTQQSLVFRAKGKVISFIVMTPGAGVAKAALLSLGTLTISKPINTLKDPT